MPELFEFIGAPVKYLGQEVWFGEVDGQTAILSRSEGECGEHGIEVWTCQVRTCDRDAVTLIEAVGRENVPVCGDHTQPPERVAYHPKGHAR